MATKNKNFKEEIIKLSEDEVASRLWAQSWTYVKAVVDIVREPILILDKDLRVMAANETFYKTFQVEKQNTEKKMVYDLGNGEWNIPALKKLLEEILPAHTFFKGFEVNHEFPFIGPKVMILNAREIHFEGDDISDKFPPIILLAIEDITEIMYIAKTFAGATGGLEVKLNNETKKLQSHIGHLEEELKGLKAKL
jgi:chemotaxis protein methyltransferase CheR